MSILIKAKNNYEIANYCVNKRYYDVAISRYYYFLYQIIIDYVKRYDPDFDISEEKNSHNQTIDRFIKIFIELNDIKKDINNKIRWLYKLKKERVYSDYKERIIREEQEFKKIFYSYYIEIENIFKNFRIMEFEYDR